MKEWKCQNCVNIPESLIDENVYDWVGHQTEHSNDMHSDADYVGQGVQHNTILISHLKWICNFNEID